MVIGTHRASHPDRQVSVARSAWFGRIGRSLSIVGALLLLPAFTTLDWFQPLASDPARLPIPFRGSTTVVGVHDFLSTFQSYFRELPPQALSFGLSGLYFAWLGWVLLVAVLVSTLIACLPVRAARTAGIFACASGLAAAVLTVVGLDLFTFGGPFHARFDQMTHARVDFGFFIGHAYLGAWFAVAGFVIAGIGAFVGSGPHRWRDRPRLRMSDSLGGALRTAGSSMGGGPQVTRSAEIAAERRRDFPVG